MSSTALEHGRVDCFYRVLYNMFKRIANLKGLTPAQKKDIFHDTAVRTYKLDDTLAAKL